MCITLTIEVTINLPAFYLNNTTYINKNKNKEHGFVA